MSSTIRRNRVIISRTAEYALRAVVHLAAAEGETVSQTVGQIAAGTQVPLGYLSKVLQSLSRAGLIVSQRGLGAAVFGWRKRHRRLQFWKWCRLSSRWSV